MGARRRRKNERLPKYVYTGKSAYVYRPYANGRRGKEIPLCPLAATTLEIWEAYEYHTGNLDEPKQTLEWLCDQYMTSEKFLSLSRFSIKENTLYHKRILNKVLDDGTLFGDVLLDDITAGVIRGYLDSRSEVKVTANREVSYLGAVFSWGYQRDKVTFNPVKGVTKYKETPRKLYVTDEMYQQFYDIADKPWYLRPMMEISYLCRMRRIEVLDIKKSDIKKEGLLTRRAKGSNDAMTLWTPRLKLAIDACLGQDKMVESIFLLSDKQGQPIKDGTFTTEWGLKWRKKADKSWVRFTYHDIKAKGVSDFDGDKQVASGHKTAAMVATYDRKLKEIKATK